MARPRNWFANILIITGILLGLMTAGSAQAANWFKLRGTEPGGTAHTLQVWGFLQPTFADDSSDEISGAVGGLAPANGTVPFPGTLPPRDDNGQTGFFMRRARIGIRGTMLPINNDIDYFILTEWGENGVTRSDGGANLLDASVTFNQLSRGVDEDGLANLGGRLRIGQFLFSQTSQALSQSTPGRRVHIFMPEGTLQFALTRRTENNAPGNFTGTNVDGARDIGIELFDWAEFKDPIFGGSGPLEFTYSVGLGNGGTIGEQNRDDNFRQYYWLSLAKLFDNTRGPRRHDMMVYGFYQKGDIEFNNDVNGDGIGDDRFNPSHSPVNGLVCDANSNGVATIADGDSFCAGNQALLNSNLIANDGNARDEEQEYWGVGFEYFNKPFENFGQIRFETEYQRQDGLIFAGTGSPSSLFRNTNDLGFRYIPDGESDAWHVDLGYDIHQHLGLRNRTTINVRYDEINRAKDDAQAEVTFKTTSITGEYFFHKKARVALTYQIRDFDADDRVGGARINGNAVLGQIDNRIGVQVTFIYKNVLLR